VFKTRLCKPVRIRGNRVAKETRRGCRPTPLCAGQSSKGFDGDGTLYSWLEQGGTSHNLAQLSQFYCPINFIARHFKLSRCAFCNRSMSSIVPNSSNFARLI
jgi:hypothetical protein